MPFSVDRTGTVPEYRITEGTLSPGFDIEVLSFDPEAGRGVCIFNGTLASFEGKVAQRSVPEDFFHMEELP